MKIPCTEFLLCGSLLHLVRNRSSALKCIMYSLPWRLSLEACASAARRLGVNMRGHNWTAVRGNTLIQAAHIVYHII